MSIVIHVKRSSIIPSEFKSDGLIPSFTSRDLHGGTGHNNNNNLKPQI